MRMTLADFDSFANAFARYADSKERILGFRPASVFSAPSVSWLVEASKTMGASIRHINLGDGHGFGDGDAVCISDAYECDPPLYIWVNNGELSRPAPKVLDADDVEIKAGETLYRITTGEPVTVEALENVKCMEVLDAKGDSWNAQFLTHERPVFDANGERICKGDTVWDLDSGERLHVEEFANRECGLVQCSNEEGGDCEDYDARRLTHREPDSLEKLRDDLYTLAARDDGDIEVEIVIFADRLTALIERG